MFRLARNHLKAIELIDSAKQLLQMKWPEDDSLRVETCSHVKLIII
jgi:hypothetical protein